MKKIGKILIVILSLLILSVLCYWLVKNYYKGKSESTADSQSKYSSLDKENILNSNIYNKEFEAEKIDENLRKEFINYTENNIDQLVSFSSNYDSGWIINRFSFVNNNNFYVEYNDDHALGRILVYCVKSSEAINCSRISYFIPENFIWKIDEGDDPFVDRILQHYEKNKDNVWKKSFKSNEIFYFPASRDTLLGLQQAADSSIDLWRLDPTETVKRDMADVLRLDLEKIESKIKSRKDDSIILKISYQDSIYEAYLKQSVKKGETGIWVIQYLRFVK
jgi:hypothetical protein